MGELIKEYLFLSDAEAGISLGFNLTVDTFIISCNVVSVGGGWRLTIRASVPDQISIQVS